MYFRTVYTKVFDSTISVGDPGRLRRPDSTGKYEKEKEFKSNRGRTGVPGVPGALGVLEARALALP